MCNASICLHRALYLLLFYSSVCRFVHSLSLFLLLSLTLSVGRSLSPPSLFIPPFFYRTLSFAFKFIRTHSTRVRYARQRCIRVRKGSRRFAKHDIRSTSRFCYFPIFFPPLFDALQVRIFFARGQRGSRGTRESQLYSRYVSASVWRQDGEEGLVFKFLFKHAFVYEEMELL